MKIGFDRNNAVCVFMLFFDLRHFNVMFFVWEIRDGIKFGGEYKYVWLSIIGTFCNVSSLPF